MFLISGIAFGQIDTRLGGKVIFQQQFNERYAVNSANPENIEMVSDPAGSERTVLRMRVRDTDRKVYGGIRTEISPQREYKREGIRWYAISVYFPKDWEFHPYPTIVGQLHTSQKTMVVSPPVSLVVKGDNLDLELHSNTGDMEKGEVVTKENSTRQIIRLDKLKLEKWYCFVMRVDWSYMPGMGSFKLWMNGDKVYESVNTPNSYQTWLGNYPKAGIYMPGMMGVSERTVYIDFIHLGGVRTGYEDMQKLTPCQYR